MEISTILTADVLDIIFEGRNKDYGAYDLRKSYNRRLVKSLLMMGALCILMFTGYVASGFLGKKNNGKIVEVQDIELKDIKQPEKEQEVPPPPPPKPPEPPKVEMAKFTPPRIVKDDEVKPDEKPPEVEKLEDTKIGNMNQEGVKDDGIVAPPSDNGTTGVIETPKKEEEDWDRTFTKVEIESMYPGGMAAWARFLHKNLNYPQEAADNGIQGTVLVQFIVDKEGIVSDVTAVSGPQELRAEAIRVIKKSGKWTPAVQNGRQVKSYKSQPVGFRLNDSE
jgi:periplasmic protein TonB